MSETKTQPAQLPPEIARYLVGAKTESLQFDFLIGNWTVDGARYHVAGEVILKFAAVWQAKYLHDRRMVMDDFTVYSPSGREVSSYVTLRTYSDITNRWEITGLAPFQQAIKGEWFGLWNDGEMTLHANSLGPAGTFINSKIRFYNITQGVFQWENHHSLDDGKTWFKVASLVAVRKQDLRQT